MGGVRMRARAGTAFEGGAGAIEAAESPIAAFLPDPLGRPRPRPLPNPGGRPGPGGRPRPLPPEPGGLPGFFFSPVGSPIVGTAVVGSCAAVGSAAAPPGPPITGGTFVAGSATSPMSVRIRYVLVRTPVSQPD